MVESNHPVLVFSKNTIKLLLHSPFLPNSVSRLQGEVEEKFGLNVDNQILLVSGGFRLGPDDRLPYNGAGLVSCWSACKSQVHCYLFQEFPDENQRKCTNAIIF